MAVSSRSTRIKRFSEYRGVDKRSSELRRGAGWAIDMDNMQFTKSNELEKRKGYKSWKDNRM